MSISNPTEKEIYSIFSAGQLEKVITELSSAPLPDDWYLYVEDGDWKEYVSESKYLRFEGEISDEEIEEILGPAVNGNGDRQYMIELWEFESHSDDKYDYIFCVSIDFVNDLKKKKWIATTGETYWKKMTRQDI